jgi:RNA polymerase sigma-70 factor (ECF subfamily)
MVMEQRGEHATQDERFTHLFRSYYGHVLAYARRRATPDAAQEATCETFLAAWRHLDELPASPLPWLYRAASFEIAHQRRLISRKNRTAQALVEASKKGAVVPDPADGVAASDRWTSALSSLGETDKEVLLLTAWEGLSPKEAAVVLGCSATAYKVRLHRARRRLSHLVEDEPRSTERPVVPEQDAPCQKCRLSPSFVALGAHPAPRVPHFAPPTPKDVQL